MTPEQEETIFKAIPILKEFVTRPEILAQLKDEGKKVVFEEIMQFERELQSRKQGRLLREKQQGITDKIQRDCSHIAGTSSGGSVPDIAGRTSIVWHRISPTDPIRDVGVCTGCLRKFFPEDGDYAFWRRQPSFSRLSIAGIEAPMNEGEEVPEIQFIPTSRTFYARNEPLIEADFLDLSFEDLNNRSTFEIRKVMEYVRESRRKAKDAEETK
jgi:hypothetical protein